MFGQLQLLLLAIDAANLHHFFVLFLKVSCCWAKTKSALTLKFVKGVT